MTHQDDTQTHNVRTSREASSEGEEIHSDKATSGSSDLDFDEVASTYASARVSRDGHPRHIPRRQTQDQQAAQTNSPDRTRETMSSLDGSSLRGLTPAPVSPDMLPIKRRTLGEVLSDNTPPPKDKLSAEIDGMSRETLRLHNSPAGSLEDQTATPSRSRQQKKSRASGKPSTSQVSSLITDDSATGSDGSKTKPSE